MGKYGKVITGVGSTEHKEIDIVEILQANYKDNRVISVAKLEDETFVLAVKNPPSTGRANAEMWLSKDSVIGLISAALLYFSTLGIDFTQLLSESIQKDEISVAYSDNLLQRLKDANLLD